MATTRNGCWSFVALTAAAYALTGRPAAAACNPFGFDAPVITAAGGNTPVALPLAATDFNCDGKAELGGSQQ